MVLKTRTILFAVLTLAACSNDSEPQVQADGEIRLSVQVAGSTRAVNDATALQDAGFTEGTKVSVKVTDNATSNPVGYLLALYTVGSGGALELPEGQKQYYPASGSSVNIYAFHPAGAAATFAVQTDQSTTDNYKASDLMWASLSNVTSTSASHTLAFTHKLSKIIVSLVAGAGCSASDLATATISVGSGDLVTSGSFTAASGTFTPAASGTGTITIATNAGTTAHAATIVPQAMSGKTINVTLNGITRSYTITTPQFVAGTKYTYSLQVNTSGIVLVSTQINPWIDDAGNVTSPESPLVI